jgi:lipoprotein-anchoring transpeptidase ErfK/SrfK
MVTQGCIRMKNSDLQDLKKKVFVGMKVVITEN